MTDMPYCKYGHYEEWDGLPECINEVVSSHEAGNHDEQRNRDCPECDSEMSAEMERYRPRVIQAPMTRDEVEAMRADRKLMRDEFHVR